MLYTWRSLSEAVRNIVTPGRLVLDLVWKRPGKKETSNIIDVDILVGDKKLAPFVSPIEGGTVMSKLGRSMRSIQAPRIRMKIPFTPVDFNQRGPGMPIYASEADRVRSEQERIAVELQGLKDKAMRRLHWMACKALTGKIAVEQDNIAFEIDFQFATTHKPVLEGTGLFSHADANPPAKLKEYKRLVSSDSGLNADTVLFGTSAADAFLAHAKTKDAFNTLNVNRGTIDTTKDSNYLGRFDGMDLYEVAEQYVDDAGAAQSLIDPKAMIVLSTQGRYDLGYGAVNDRKAGGNIVTDWFSKVYDEEDPSVTWLLVETNPLPQVNQPNSVVYATVLS